MSKPSRLPRSLAPGALLACAVAAGCSSGAGHATVDAGPPPAAGGTGAFGVVTVGGKQKMYLPVPAPNAAGDPVVAVVDVGAAGSGVQGAPALLAQVDLGPPAGGALAGGYATATGGDASTVVVVSTVVPTVWFIDPTTDTLAGSTSLDPSYGQSSFSGGGGYVTGVAIDGANHRAILSVWDGFAIVDLTSRTVTRHIAAPPSENFGFDSVHGRVLAPFYECTSSADPMGAPPAACNTPKAPDGTVMTDGLSLIDLSDGTVYTYENAAGFDGGAGGASIDPTAPVGLEPDSAAIDPTTGIAVVPSEGGDFQSVLDFSQAQLDPTNKIVTAPQKVIPGLGLTGVAIEPASHLAFWEEERASDVAVADLTRANAGSTAWVHGQMPALPDGSAFSNLGDPHGVAVTTGLTSRGPVGFIVDAGMRWVARVDLAAMVANEQADATTELTDAQMAAYVTFLDGATQE